MWYALQQAVHEPLQTHIGYYNKLSMACAALPDTVLTECLNIAINWVHTISKLTMCIPR